jgi:hypothetical protein
MKVRVTRRAILKATLGGITAAALERRLAQGSSTAALEAAYAGADDLPSEVAWRWFETLYDLVKAQSIPPTLASRIYAAAAICLYEAVVPSSQQRRSLAGQLHGLGSATGGGSGSDVGLVVNTAMAGILRRLLPGGTGKIDAAEHEFEPVSASSLSPSERDASRYAGTAVVSTISNWLDHDGSAWNLGRPYVPSGATGSWQPTPPGFGARPLHPGWGFNRPMVLSSATELPAPVPPPFSTLPGTRWFDAAMEVYRTGRNLTPEQKSIADFWADNPGQTGTPPGHWIALVSQIAREEGLSLSQAAEAYARVGIAVHEAFICCWWTKYATDLMRPVSFIRAQIDPAWSPYVTTPGFPTYTSGHSTQSAAAAAVLTAMFGTKSFTDRTHQVHGQAHLPPRSFSSFNEAAKEAAVSRLFGGIHYTFDNNDGMTIGHQIGNIILQRLRFKA